MTDDEREALHAIHRIGEALECISRHLLHITELLQDALEEREE